MTTAGDDRRDGAAARSGRAVLGAVTVAVLAGWIGGYAAFRHSRLYRMAPGAPGAPAKMYVCYDDARAGERALKRVFLPLAALDAWVTGTEPLDAGALLHTARYGSFHERAALRDPELPEAIRERFERELAAPVGGSP